MKTTMVLCALFLLVSCGPLNRLQRASLPIAYDNVTVSIVTDNVLSFPQTPDKEFVKIIASHLDGATKAEITKQGSLKTISACEPRTLKAVQEITGITANTITDVSTGFLPFQLFRGSATSTKSDAIYINTTTTVVDCENNRTLGAYNYQGYGYSQYTTEILQEIALYNVYYIYTHQRR